MDIVCTHYYSTVNDVGLPVRCSSIFRIVSSAAHGSKDVADSINIRKQGVHVYTRMLSINSINP